LHLFDILLLIAVAIFTFIGLRRGLIGELFRLIALIGGLIVAFLFSKYLYEFIPYVENQTLKIAISFLVLFLAAAVALHLIGWLIKKIVHFAMLGWADRLFGALLGACKVTVAFWLFVLLVNIGPKQLQQALSPAVSYQLLSQIPLSVTVPESLPKKQLQTLTNAKDSVQALRTRIDSAKSHYKQIDTLLHKLTD